MNRFAKHAAMVAGVLALAAGLARESRAAVNVSPSLVTVTPGRANTFTIRYQFTGLLDVGAVPPPYNGIEDSPLGTFLGPTRASLGTVPTAVIANIVNGSGTATESLTIPASVIDTAVRLGIRQITFERTFAGAANSPTTQVAIAIASSEAVGPLRVLRTELYFENRRGEITVHRNQRGLMAFADIRYGGSGVLTGFWEVDGRRLLDVNRQLNFGTSVTLSTPEVPDLPTFDTGAHIVRLVLTSPAPAGALPQLLYYVTAGREMRPIRIALEEAGGGTGPARRSFSWEKPAGMDLFFLEFSEEADGKPLFSAFTREAGYTLPEKGLEEIFTPGKKYFWRVKGYDANDEQVGISEPAPFRY